MCPWAPSVIVMAYQDLEQKEKENAHSFNKNSIWSFLSNTVCKGSQREARLTSPISYYLSVYLIWSDVGQLPFWAAESRHILAARLAANKASWNSLSQIFFPSAFIYKSQYCYYEYIMWVLRFTYLFHALAANNVLLISALACIHTSSTPTACTRILYHFSSITWTVSSFWFMAAMEEFASFYYFSEK